MELTRRRFIELTGVAGIAAATLTACASSTSSEGESDEQADGAVESPVETLEADVVVCGSGTAGTYAAVRAAELGAAVVWLEKNSTLGGTSAITEGIATIDGINMREAGIDPLKDQLYHDFMESQNWGAVPEVLAAYIENNGPATDWAIGNGARIQYAPVSPDTYWGGVCFADDGSFMHLGEGMLQPLWDLGETMDNLELCLSTPATSLIMDGGKVSGVMAQGQSGPVRINAKAVILATGGFADNIEMVEQYVDLGCDGVYFLGIPGRDGEGINMALSAGGKLHGAGAAMYTSGMVEGTNSIGDIVNMAFGWSTCLGVNERGERFYNEDTCSGNNTYLRNIAVRNQKTAWSITDDASIQGLAAIAPVDFFTGVTEGDLLQEIESYDAIVKGDTVADLASAMGVPADALQASFDEYNAILGGAEDVKFGLGAEYGVPLGEGPYYAAKIQCSAYSTEAGATTDEKMRVISKETGEPIEGLFAVGNDNGSLYNTAYPMHVIGGTGQGFAAASGFVAAQSAVAL